MKGIVSFHPVDTRFFERVVVPILAGSGTSLDEHLAVAVRFRRNAWQAGRWTRSLLAILDGAALPPLAPLLARPRTAGELVRTSVGLIRSPRAVLGGIRARLERLDHRLDATSRLVVAKVDPDLHLFGRPYLVTESTVKGVADAVDRYVGAPGAGGVDNLALEQLGALDPGLVHVEPADGPPLSSDFEYRSEVFREIKMLSEVPRAVRRGQPWLAPDGSRRPAAEILQSELPWTAVRVHSRVIPSWVARDVDGLATMCDRAGTARPRCLSDAAALFAGTGELGGLLTARLRNELAEPRDLGAYVAPDRIGELLEFLTVEGARIIRAAARFGEGDAAASLLRKIRECAAYAEKHGSGYLEVSGILPPDRPDLDESDVARCSSARNAVPAPAGWSR